MATQMKTAKGDIESLNRYGIADAARIRITAQILRNVARPSQKQTVQLLAPNKPKAKASA
jgi:3-methyladenine DNA glycosylase AlkD